VAVVEVDSVVVDNKKLGLWMRLSLTANLQKRSSRRLVLQKQRVFTLTVYSFKLLSGIKEVLMNQKKNKCILHSLLSTWVLKKLKKDKVKKTDHKHLNVLFTNTREEQIYILLPMYGLIAIVLVEDLFTGRREVLPYCVQKNEELKTFIIMYIISSKT
jgi:hypothetical protein